MTKTATTRRNQLTALFAQYTRRSLHNIARERGMGNTRGKGITRDGLIKDMIKYELANEKQLGKIETTIKTLEEV
jgi:hypothetical protein